MSPLFFFVFLQTSLCAFENDAERLFEAALYDRAIPLYQQIRQNDNSKETTYRLAQCYFLSGKYVDVIALLEESQSDSRLLYLSALSHDKMSNYDQAALHFEKYLENPANLDFRNEAQFELGKTYFFLGRFPEALSTLTNLQTHEPRTQALATLYKARCSLAQNKPDEAEAMLSKLEFPADDPLHFEASYLRGEAAFQNENYSISARFFEQALPQNLPENMSWYRETLYHLAWSYIKLGQSTQEKKPLFDKAEAILQKLSLHSSDEKALLALGQCYLAMKDEEAYRKAEALFSRQGIFISQETRTQALLLLAEAAPTYLQRDTLYRHLTQDANCDAQAWYLRGLNDLNEGKKLLYQPLVENSRFDSARQSQIEASRSERGSLSPGGKGDEEGQFGKAAASKNGNFQLEAGINDHQDHEARKAFERASNSLQKAVDQLFGRNLVHSALKHLIHALILQENHRQALAKLEEFKDSLSGNAEIPYLYALAASKLPENEGVPLVEESLKQATGEFVDDVLNVLGTLYFRKQEYAKAEPIFLRLSKEFPESPFAGDALYWIARCAESRQDFEMAKDFKRQAFERYPNSRYAPEAYFTYYTYRDYLQGDRAAIKHLDVMVEKYPQSPFLIQAWYLIGLDYERDRKTEAGKWIRKKNLMAAIDAFQEAEAVFDTLNSQGILQKQDIDFLTLIRYRAILERALANMTISDNAQGAKRQIYLEYAEEVLKQIINDCQNLQHPLQPYMTHIKSHGKIEDESTYWLAQAYVKSNNDVESEKILSEMLEKYHLAKISRGYFLSRCWYDKGLIALRAKNPALSLECLQRSEDAAKGNVLSVEEKLDLWIHQSLCHQELRDLDTAILILSKVVNDDSISSLRVKAMFLRAEAYEQQGRRELARKQLEATAKKGGEWASKAKEKLDKQYGYQ